MRAEEEEGGAPGASPIAEAAGTIMMGRRQRRRWPPSSWLRSGRSAGVTAVAVAGAVLLLLLGLPLVLVGPFSASEAGISSGGGSSSPEEGQHFLTRARRGLQVNFASLFFWNLRQTAQELLMEQAAVLEIDPERVADAFATTDPLAMALGIDQDVRTFNAAWEGLWLRNSRTCLADDAERLREAIHSPLCAVVLLVPGRKYLLESQIQVNMTKALIGSPAERPIIDASDAERAFIVRRGVFFDVRHILFCKCSTD